MGLQKIIVEEIQKLVEYPQQGIYNIHDLAGLMTRMGFDKESTGHLASLLIKDFQRGGDDAVINRYAEMTGTNIYPMSRGRYVFQTQPHDPGQRQYQEEQLDEIIGLLEGVGDRYAQSKFNITDKGEEFQQRWQQHQKTQERSAENGELVAQVSSRDDLDGKADSKINIYKNPKSLRNFEDFVRAVGDEQGNIYVAQLNGSFYHQDIENEAGVYGQHIINFYRVENSNLFGVSGTYLRQVTGREDANSEIGIKYIQEHPYEQQAFKALNRNNPDLRFSYYPAHVLMGNRTPEAEIQQSVLKEGAAIGDDSGYMQFGIKEVEDVVREELDFLIKNNEGVGDKYAEKAFGIPDTQQQDYQRQTAGAARDSGMGKLAGYSVNNYSRVKKPAPVYLNPKSLKNFDPEVRAVSTEDGNLYVAQFDGDFVHDDMQQAMNTNHAVYDTRYNITWMRVGNENAFGFSDSMVQQIDGISDSEKEDVYNRIHLLENRFPEFSFHAVMWYQVLAVFKATLN